MRIARLLLVVGLALATPVAALAQGWKIDGGPASPPLSLTFGYDASPVRYRFQCEHDHVLILETGVTDLMDVESGVKVGDGPGATMTHGAALLGLLVDQGQPRMAPAKASANATRGWDLSIEVPLEDATLQALRRAKAMSLFTTGWTGLVQLGPEDRQLIASFLDQCAALEAPGRTP